MTAVIPTPPASPPRPPASRARRPLYGPNGASVGDRTDPTTSALLSAPPPAPPAPVSTVAPARRAAPSAVAAPSANAPATTGSALATKLKGHGAAAGWGLVGLVGLVVVWSIVAAAVDEIPTPAESFARLVELGDSAFYDGGSAYQGIGLQLLGSLKRVLMGFAMAAVLGIPVGLLIGSVRKAWQAVNPVVQLLRPVSPLAWFPIWLVVFKNAPTAAVWVIFITALWPIILNTAAAAAEVPVDQRNVARVFRFNRTDYIRHILVPNALPGVVTGLRLSMGVSWMVIVAVEMLSGGKGIGFFVWDAYNALSLSSVVAAIACIGGIGLALDLLFLRLSRLVAQP